MPRGVEFTDQQRSVLKQIMKTAWARHYGKAPKMTRRWVNPGERWHGQASSELWQKREKAPLGSYDRAFAEGGVIAHYQSEKKARELGMSNPRPTRKPKPKLSNLLLPAAIIGAIVWFARKPKEAIEPGPFEPG